MSYWFLSLYAYGIRKSGALGTPRMANERSQNFPRLIFEAIKKLVSRRIRAWSYLLNGPTLIQKGYDAVRQRSTSIHRLVSKMAANQWRNYLTQSNGRPYEVPAPDTRYVFVSSPEHIRELDKAPDACLSSLPPQSM